MSNKQVRGQYTREFKPEAVRLVKTGQSLGMTAKALSIPKAILSCQVLGVSASGYFEGQHGRQQHRPSRRARDA